MFKDIELIIYDLDGVLIDSNKGILESFRLLHEEIGEPAHPSKEIPKPGRARPLQSPFSHAEESQIVQGLEKAQDVLTPINSTLRTPETTSYSQQQQIASLTKEINEKGVLVETPEEEKTIETDTVILADMYPMNDLGNSRQGVYTIGDAVIPRRGNSAILDGYKMGMRL